MSGVIANASRKSRTIGRRTVLKLAAGGLAGGIAAPRWIGSARAEAQTTITVWTWGGVERFAPRVAAFKRLYPEAAARINVQVVSPGKQDPEVYQALRLALTSGGALPDLVTRYFCRLSDELARLEGIAPVRSGVSDWNSEVRAALSDSVKHHLVADVPVAVFLSAGLDSAALTALAAEQSPRSLCSVTLGFSEYRDTSNDETAYAGMVAQRYRTDHHTRWFCRDDFEAEMSRIVSAMDQPSTDGINTYFVSKAAHACGVKTAFSGLGGDELFGTYPSFKDVPRMVRLFSGNALAAAGYAIRRLTSPLLGRTAAAKYAGLLEYGGTFAGAYLLRRGLFMPWEMTRILPRETVREGWKRLDPLERLAQTVAGIKSARLKVSALEMTWYMRNQLLRDSDWAGMAHSVEIRVPMIDIAVLRALAPLLANRRMEGKRVLGEVPAKRLPGALLERPKTGFGVPVHEWVSPPQFGAPPRTLSMGLRNWALRLAREFDLAA